MRRRPLEPGIILARFYLPVMGRRGRGISAHRACWQAEMERRDMDKLLKGALRVTRPVAVQMARLVGNSPEFWLDLQRRVDDWDAQSTDRTVTAET